MLRSSNIGHIGHPSLLDRLYRRISPIPPSPSPRTKDENYKLPLVPAAALTDRLEEILHLLQSQTSAQIGDYAEFGVYNGTSMGCMFDALSRLRLDRIQLFGFDSFMGLPPEASQEDGGVWKPGQFACPKQVTIENLSARGVPLNRVHLVEGWYRDTLGLSPDDYGIERVSVVMMDCDAYSSARLALAFIHPVLANVAAIAFDDWKLNDLDIKGMGEFRAFNEFLSHHAELSIETLPGYNRKSKIFILRKHS